MPNAWFAVGAGVASVGIVIVARVYFDIPLHFGALAVLMTFVLALVASRATGESDITPTGAMGKIVQLAYGVLMTQNATANSDDRRHHRRGRYGRERGPLLTDLKSGYLLGANPAIRN